MMLSEVERERIHKRFNAPNRLVKEDKCWERYFEETCSKSGEELRKRFEWMVQRVRGPVVLDVGCSTGLGPWLFSGKTGVTRSVGIEVQESVVALAKERCRGHAVEIEHGFAEDMPFDADTFDTVVLGEVLEHVDDDKVVLAEACRVAKNDGVVVATVPDGGRISHNHLRVYNEKSFRGLMETFCQVNEMERVSGRLCCTARAK